MKRFRYPYDKILSLKSFIKKEKEMAFSEIAFKINKLKNQVREKRDFLLNQNDIYKNNKMEIFKRLYNDRIAQEIILLENEIESMMEEYDRRRKEYIKAKQQEQIYEKLKEKMFREYKNEFYKEENKLLDEVGTNNFLKTINNGREL